MIFVAVGKVVVGSVMAAGVSTVVNNMIKATTPVGLKAAEKALVWVGGIVIGSACSTVAYSWVEEGACEITENIKDKIDARRELKRQRKQES